MIHKIIKHFTITQFKDCYIAYGGLKAIAKSPYLYIAMILTLISMLFENKPNWNSNALSILPNTIGFSIAAYAIVLSLNNSNFIDLLTHAIDKNDTPPIVTIGASFAHFIIIQTITILYTITFKDLCNSVLLIDILGTLLLFYSIMLVLAIVFNIFWLTKLMVQFNEKIKKDNEK